MAQDWLMEKDNMLQRRRREEKRRTWHIIKCILSSCFERGGSGRMLTNQTLNTIKVNAERRMVTQMHMSRGHLKSQL